MKQNAMLMKANARQLSAPTEVSSTALKKLKMFNPKRFCGGAVKSEIFIGSLHSNFGVHSIYFPKGDIDYVQYVLDNLGTLASHPNTNQLKMNMTDPISWGQNLLKDKNLYLFDVELFVTQLRILYGDKEKELNTGICRFTKFLQGHYDKNEGVGGYANRLWKLWWEANRDETTHFSMLYHHVWVGLKFQLWPKFKPFTSENGMFETCDPLFDRAADVDIKPN
jgi:hypothetical protein